MPDETPARVRLNLISEIADAARPIHMFRPGTFTDSAGREATFSLADVHAILAQFQANRRRKPPITEQHDFGRAIGRIHDLWADADGNLYGQPRWNKAGRALLEDEVYDGFSCELERVDETWTLIGGSLTNYPAVSGLDPITLAAPPALVPARVDTNPPSEEQSIMPDELLEEQPTEAPALPPLTPPTFTASDPAVAAQVNAVVAQMTAQFEAQRQIVLEQAQAQFQRQLAEMQAQQAIATYAQHVTTPTMQRQHALPLEAAALTTFLSSLNTSQRQAAQGLFDRILDAGLLSFEEIGAAGEGEGERDVAREWNAAINAKVALGMSRSAAIEAIKRENPDLFIAYGKGGR